jgi:hypothetical protein
MLRQVKYSQLALNGEKLSSAPFRWKRKFAAVSEQASLSPVSASRAPQPANGVSGMPVKPGSQASRQPASGSSANCASVSVSVAVVM